MNVVGLITEYNPFHQGHAYHIEQSRKNARADYAIAVMSGDFVQRGTPAVIEKHKRAEMALLHGADLVLELPVCYSTGSAEYFAKGAVSLLEQLGAVTHLSFGSEYGDIAPFLSISRVIAKEKAPYRQKLQEELKKGRTFPEARAAAILSCMDNFPANFPMSKESLPQFLASPNNILGLEYCKALRQQNSPIIPLTVSRKGCGYHNASLAEYASATGIRTELLSEQPDWIILSVVLPREIYRILQEAYGKTLPMEENDFSLLLKYRILQETRETLSEYLDLSPELASRIKKLENDCTSFTEFAKALKTKDITYSRICRALTHLLLNIKEAPPISYARILGMRKEAGPLLSMLKKKSRIPLITKLADSDHLLSPPGKEMLKKDVFASNLYESVLCHKFGKPYVHEYQKEIVIR